MQTESPVWVGLQQVVTRGLVAVKFLYVGRILGPGAVGEVVIALLAIGLAEALTQIGLEQSIVQSERPISPRRRSIAWTLQFVRGITVASGLMLASDFVAGLLGSPSSRDVIRIAALIPAMRSGMSLGFIVAQRNRRFRAVGLVNMVAAMVDMGFTVLLLAYGYGVIGVLLGNAAAEATRLLLSHLIFPMRVRLLWKPSEVADLLRYGRWVWSGGLLAVAIEQVDKAVLGIWLGVEQLGLYQMAGRLAQLGVAEVGLVVGRYLFPTFSQLNRARRQEISGVYSTALNMVMQLSAILALVVLTIARDLVIAFLGQEWTPMTPYLIVLTVTMIASGLHAPLAAYHRGVGRPSVVTRASAIQLTTAVVLYAALGSTLGGLGVAIATSISSALASLLLYLSGPRICASGATIGVLLLCGAVVGLSVALPDLKWLLVLTGLAMAGAIVICEWRVPLRKLIQTRG